MIKILFFFAALHCGLFAGLSAPGITVVYDAQKKAVDIKWQQNQSGIKTFIIQRSANNKDWADIARQEIVRFDISRLYQYSDYRTVAGQNYYRLKCITSTGQIEYSNVIMVIAGASSNNWVMYPVPVGDVLTLQYKGTEKIEGVVNVYIQNIAGRVLTRIRSASLNTIIKIPVSNLGKGIYDIRIIVEGVTVWNQRFLK
jgi:Secretion system C-terminal sorting domain